MKNKLVILMLALLCVACVGKSPQKSEANSQQVEPNSQQVEPNSQQVEPISLNEEVHSSNKKVCLEFWTTYSTSNNSGRNIADVINAFPTAKSIAQACKAENPEAILGSLDALVVVNYGGGIVGFVENEKDKQVVDEYLALPQVAACFPKEVIFMWSNKPDKWFNDMFVLYAIYDADADGVAPLDGSVVTNAYAQPPLYGGGAYVEMTMNDEGARKWEEITETNIGEPIAIVVDGRVYSAPVVNQKIESGLSTISGDFTIEEAEELAKSIISHK